MQRRNPLPLPSKGLESQESGAAKRTVFASGSPIPSREHPGEASLNIIKLPLTTGSARTKTKSNTSVFTVDAKAKKAQFKEAVKKLYDICDIIDMAKSIP